jgi:uncharacterized protein YjbI with pentapeptide repeats
MKPDFWPNLLARSVARERGGRLEQVLALLNSPSLAGRCGAIFALEGLCREDESLAEPLVEVLSAFVRRHTSAAHAIWDEKACVSNDVQAALAVLGRRVGRERENRPLDLHGISLREAYLPFSNFAGAFLYDCDLEGALLCGADLRGAWLWRTNLERANLDGADLRGADLAGARCVTSEQLRSAIVDDVTRLPRLDVETHAPRGGAWRQPSSMV